MRSNYYLTLFLISQLLAAAVLIQNAVAEERRLRDNDEDDDEATEAWSLDDLGEQFDGHITLELEDISPEIIAELEKSGLLEVVIEEEIEWDGENQNEDEEFQHGVERGSELEKDDSKEKEAAGEEEESYPGEQKYTIAMWLLEGEEGGWTLEETTQSSLTGQ
tara:strand:- start:225 stop:713 length:489 start_codon:yes stop_codon:yes gene_type:complete